jgi:putative addiction module component (TIGR02574 family)
MSQVLDQARIETMAIDERMDLIGLLWDSMTEADANEAVPDWHRSEVMRRQAEADTNPEASVPWDQAKERLLGRT